MKNPGACSKLDPQFLHIHAILPKSSKLWAGNVTQGTRFNREAEFAWLDFHSLRLEERFTRTIATRYMQPDKSIGGSTRGPGRSHGLKIRTIYRMIGNENVDCVEILRA
jgi:hypothetical protein